MPILKGNHVKSSSWCYVWMLPLVWTLVSFAAAHYPGDEYGLWGVGSLAGVWIIVILGNVSSVWEFLPFVLAAGAASMAVVGLLLDLLRTPRRWWLILWGVTAVAFSDCDVVCRPCGRAHCFTNRSHFMVGLPRHACVPPIRRFINLVVGIDLIRSASEFRIQLSYHETT